jgi:hypothetical protein
MTIPAEQVSPFDFDRVMSFHEWCGAAGFSSATGRRVLKAGNGPPITRLSERRIGIRMRHHLAWLDSRQESAA